MSGAMQKENQGEVFEHYRVLLFSIAYRMTGSASEAEDLVQETYLRYQASASQEIVSLKAYLSTIILVLGRRQPGRSHQPDLERRGHSGDLCSAEP